MVALRSEAPQAPVLVASAASFQRVYMHGSRLHGAQPLFETRAGTALRLEALLLRNNTATAHVHAARGSLVRSPLSHACSHACTWRAACHSHMHAWHAQAVSW
jgi:hypothetical protein